MPEPRLGDLFADRGLDLTRIGDDSADGRPMRYVAFTELLDPTPYLAGGEVILTAGRSLPVDDETQVDAFVLRLIRKGTVALGFGFERMYDTVPPLLVEACAQRGLPLFGIPAATSFARISRFVTELVARYEKDALRQPFDAQRRLVSAAGRAGGTTQVLAELAALLHGWVVLLEPSGAVRTSAGSVPDEAPARLAMEVERIRARGVRASSSLFMGDRSVSVHPLGASGSAMAYLAVGWGAEEQDLARIVVPAGVSLLTSVEEQERERLALERRLREAVARLMIDGHGDAAAVVAAAGEGLRRDWDGIRGELVALQARGTPAQLSSLAEDPRMHAVFAVFDGDVIALAPSPAVARETGRMMLAHGLAVGIALPHPAERIGQAIAQARAALESVVGAGTMREFEGGLAAGIQSVISDDVAAAWASAALAPLDETREDERARLLATTSAYLRHGGRWAAAAAEVQVHPHTLRYRIRRVEELLNSSMDSPRVRANLWLALEIRERIRHNGR